MRSSFPIKSFFCILFHLISILAFASVDNNINKDSIAKNKKAIGMPYKNESRNDETAFTQDFFQQLNSVDPQTEQNKRKAKGAIDEVEASNNFVDILKPSDISKLPVGLTKKVGACKVTIAITKAVFTPRYAELTAFAKVSIPQQPETLFFGVQGLKLSNNGGIIGAAKLVLLGDVAIPINGKNNALILKGSYDSLTGNFNSKTYITIDCNGFRQLGLAAEVSFPRGILLPVNASTGEVIPGNVKGNFETVVSDWNDIIAEFSLPKFQIAGLKDFNFTVTNAVFDFSDYRNCTDINYPSGYQQKYVSNASPESWRGIYVKDLNVALPKSFAKRSSSTRVTIGVNDLIIDNNGLTGIFYGENVLPLEEGSASGWKFSVDSIRLAIEANRITKAGFGGKIIMPAAKNTALGYGAVITASSDYIITVTNKDTLSFDLWAAKAYIDPNSYIKLSSINDQFRPEAMLHGRMGVYINKSTSTENVDANTKKIVEFNGIKFTALHIKTVTPKVSAQYFGYDGEVKVANFPISIDGISITTPTANELALNFTVKLNLHQGKISGNTSLSIISEWQQNQGIESLTYKQINIGAIAIHAELGGLTIDGSVQFLRKHPVYGDGFRGTVSAKFLDKDAFKVEVTAIFGSKEFRYWFLDGLVSGLKIPIFPPVNLAGFGGGAYYRMKKLATQTATQGTGFDYVPDSTAGLGIRAAVLFNVAKENVLDGQASFEIAFNNNGGLRYMGFFGYAKIAAKTGALTNANNFLATKFGAIDEKLNAAIGPLGDTANIIRKKMFQPTLAAKELFPTNNIPGEVGLEAFLGIQYNFDTKTLDANFDLYVNAAKGLVKGAASGNRAGWARLYIDTARWYLHMGKPDDRIGLRIGIGSIAVQTAGYLMIGHDIPDMPPPPPEVSNILNSNPNIKSGYEANPNNVKNKQPDLKAGNGFAFGTSVSITTGDINIAIFYARVDAGAGFDIFVRDLGNYTCAGENEPIGMNGWYMDGQAYAYFQGEVGIRVKLLFIKKNIPIFKLNVAALIEAHMPNPTWFKGDVGGSYSILGGMIRGHCHFSFRIGSPCQIVAIDPSKEYEDSTIDKISPDNNASAIPTLAIPEVTFKLPIGEAIDADIYGQSQYRVNVEKMELIKVSNNAVVPGTKKLSNEKYSMKFQPDGRLEGLTDYKIRVGLFFEEFRNNAWVAIYKDGARLVETKESLFKTSQQPDTIDRDNVAYTWPVINQKNFYKAETTNGYIKLKTPQPYLFTTFNNYYAEFRDEFDNKLYKAIVFDEPNNRINYELPSGLVNGRNYIFTIKGRNVAFREQGAGLDKKYVRMENGEEDVPDVIGILGEENIRRRVHDEIRELLQQHNLTNSAIEYFLSLDEMRRVSFLTAVGFDEKQIHTYINIRIDVIREMLTNRGYGSSQVDGYMEEMYQTIERKNTVAEMTISEETQRPLITYGFRVSDHNTFNSKVSSLQTTQAIIGRVSTDVINLQAKVNTYEGFDAYELQSLPDNAGGISSNTGLIQPVIECSAALDDIYYLTYIKNLLYKIAGSDLHVSPSGAVANPVLVSMAEKQFGISGRNVGIFGLIPSKALALSNYYFNEVLNGSSSNFVNQRFPFIYALPEVYNRDFLELRSKVVNYYINENLSIPAEFNSLVNDAFPFINGGEYKAVFKYKLPDGSNGSQGIFTFINQIQ
jgi:predicted enzyme related to lactoylglutathione lyase